MKLTKSKLDELRQELLAYNKEMRQSHRHDDQMSLDQYVKYCFGLTKKVSKQTFQSYVLPQPFTRDVPNYPSMDSRSSGGFAKESPKYTGDLIVGIGTMHKSNAVPVMRDTDQAKDLASMRR